ncbi:hypothetical protein BC830DRAFT_559510 [Chytriomyces sp. MP71]|nr:hypothetical protein BC830DRAFT_559510 [Chytriomyces sp. MP71]
MCVLLFWLCSLSQMSTVTFLASFLTSTPYWVTVDNQWAYIPRIEGHVKVMWNRGQSGLIEEVRVGCSSTSIFEEI